ncbi:MAG: hypothetical protein AAGF11_31755 [Myxococcota bacterium]
MLTAGDPGPLRQALGRHGSVALALGDRLGGPQWAARTRSLVEALHPAATVVSGSAPDDPFTGVTLPLDRVTDQDDAVRPRYRWTGGSLPASSEASATLVMDDAELDPGRWRALPARVVGSCQEPLAALAAGQEQSLAELEPFLDHADAVLWQVYRSTLQATVPRLSAELESYQAVRTRAEFDDNGSWEQYQCGHAYWEYLQNFVQCGAEAPRCLSAPRIFLIGGARIGTAEPSVYIPSGCAAKVGHDYVSELRTIATEAAEVAQEHLSPSWSALADRLGVVTEVYDTLSDVCVPRRRRFAPEDLVAARERLASIGRALASDAPALPTGQWTVVEQPFHVPGFGPVQQVAFYEAGEGSPSRAAVAEARALRELVLTRALCRSAHPALPLAVALVEGASGRVESFGYFFEEELFCGELPPLLGEVPVGSSCAGEDCEPAVFGEEPPAVAPGGAPSPAAAPPPP